MSLIERSEHERGPEQHHLAVVAIRERDEALLRAGKAEGEAESLRQQLAGAVDAALRDVLEEAKRRTPQLTGDQLTGDRVAMTIGYVVIDRLRGQ
jgi:uncharacterized protein (DUF2336 family)